MGWRSLDTALQRGVSVLLALCLRWGATRGRPGACPHHPRGSQGGRCDLIFLMVLSLVLLGCGGSLPSPTPEWGMLRDWKHLNFLFYFIKTLS